MPRVLKVSRRGSYSRFLVNREVTAQAPIRKAGALLKCQRLKSEGSNIKKDRYNYSAKLKKIAE